MRQSLQCLLTIASLKLVKTFDDRRTERVCKFYFVQFGVRLVSN